MSWLEAMEYLTDIEDFSRGVGPASRNDPRGLGPRPGVGTTGVGIDADVGGPARAPRGVGARPGISAGRGFNPGSFGGPLAGARGVGGPAGSQMDLSLGGEFGRGWSALQQATNAQNAFELIYGKEGNDPSTGWSDPFFAMAAENSGMQRPVYGEEGGGTVSHGGQSTSASPGGGAWAIQDQWDAHYSSASKMTGIPANVIKAFQGKETGRVTDYTGKENCEIRPESGCVALNTGIFESTAASYGLDYERIRDDPEYAAYATGVVLQHIAMDTTGYWGTTPGKTVLEEGGWEGVARIYYGGQAGYADPNWQDERGVGETAGEYAATVMGYINQLDARGTSPGTNGQSISSPHNPASNQVGSFSGKAIADLADDYVNSGIDYKWGGIPTEDQDPYATGWDCSGFVWYIMDRLGYAHSDIAGGIPQGSHYQAQWAIDHNRYYEGLDLNQLQPGDLVFMDTGADGGGGQNEVSPTASRATHVGIYLGDGKVINAMNECGPGETMGVDCGTGVVSITDPNSGWGGYVIGWADTSDIIGEEAVQSTRGPQRGGPPPASITGQGAAAEADYNAVSTPAPSGTLPRQDDLIYGSTGNVR